MADVMTAERRAAMSPQDVLDLLLEGNGRFVAGAMLERDLLAQARKAAEQGQHPVAAVVGCIDSRVPIEHIFDVGLGDVFVTRLAGAVVSDEVLGGLEFATELAGAKLVLVLGHTACGAVGGAVRGVELGHLTGLLDHLRPAVDEARTMVPEDASEADLVNAAVEAHVRRTVAWLPGRSVVLRDRIEAGELALAGAVKDLATGHVRLVAPTPST